MMPLTIIEPLQVLVIGAGRAGFLKARTAMGHQQKVTLLAPKFSPEASALGCQHIKADLYQCQLDDFSRYQLIYFAQPWPNSATEQAWLTSLIKQLKNSGKWVCVSCKPELGNVVNPCSRKVGNYLIAVSGSGNTPAITRDITEHLAAELSAFTQSN
ncbi:precorrin-2 dehydrogenase/sirohydrochlorin ferrochelatase family protein [Shewanella sp. TC10]|uniref:precorrin-2 dehydrogenase/sirohydrochlorin ferrochelatase family protein n=1 Tax=Shewanella sp. TC10 TaxID=1419739 RepID=UPI00129E4FE5|nr:NAD(P)-dependent oxidoreductase [Shewanella sp. TC10]